MKVYKVKVNGKVYEVELESVKESDAKITVPTPAAAPVAAAPAQSGAGKDLVAPMAVTILDVRVNVGQTVKVGDVICILEAMKLENEVVADCNGVITSIAVTKGTAVKNGQLIAKIG